jgi:hypothetical protein
MCVSTDSDRQVLDLQRDAHLSAGVDERHLFEDRVGGSRGYRAGRIKALAFVKSGDCPLSGNWTGWGDHCCTYSPRSRTSRNAVSPSAPLPSRWTPRRRRASSRCMCSVRWRNSKRSLIQERVWAGLAAARRRGRHGGRPTTIDAEKLTAVITALDVGATEAALCRTFGIKRSSLINTLARVGWSAGIKVPEA